MDNMHTREAQSHRGPLNVQSLGVRLWKTKSLNMVRTGKCNPNVIPQDRRCWPAAGNAQAFLAHHQGKNKKPRAVHFQFFCTSACLTLSNLMALSHPIKKRKTLVVRREGANDNQRQFIQAVKSATTAPTDPQVRKLRLARLLGLGSASSDTEVVGSASADL